MSLSIFIAPSVANLRSNLQRRKPHHHLRLSHLHFHRRWFRTKPPPLNTTSVLPTSTFLLPPAKPLFIPQCHHTPTANTNKMKASNRMQGRRSHRIFWIWRSWSQMRSKAARSYNRRENAREREPRRTLVMLGAIPPLVTMLISQDLDSQVASLYALLNPGIGNDPKKSSTAILLYCFLVRTLWCLDKKDGNNQAKQDVLRVLYNLYIFPVNILFILETDLVPFLINSIGDMEITERNHYTLSNLVSSRADRKAISCP
ncbi:hypothetical protein KIW84_050285 [Lathyrus oleraceus]|uniref:Uncharacterized protein n=1 Tax=Pisum sativum TaxID=3888 RepID=A0A9D5ABV7_PEA|nr:hypothetical protein KIW84_050285 [Pisum sativum]